METLNLPAARGYGEAMGLGWRLLRQRFWSFLWLCLLAGLLALLPLIVVALLQKFLPRLDLLWQLMLFLALNVWIAAFFRATSLALAGDRPSIAAFSGWLIRSNTWLIALLPALYALIIHLLYPTPPPGSPPSEVLHFFFSPGYLLIVLLGILVSPWYQYAYALYAGGGYSPAEAYRLAVRIYGDRLRWLFFPLVLGLFVLLGIIVLGLAFALLAALLGAGLKLLGAMVLAKILIKLLVLLYLAVFLCAAMVFVIASLSAAATNLPRSPAAGRFQP
ncbi:MAG: hypothetical protein ACP5M3_06640 [Acidithiobacillus sp.]